MGLLIDIDYPVRVDPRRAAKIFAARGLATIHVGGIRPRDRAQRDVVLAEWRPKMESTVRFRDGVMALDELERFVRADGDTMYIDVRFGPAEVRIWHEWTWVQIREMPPGGIEEAVRIVEETTGLVAPPATGKHELGVHRMVELASKHLAIYVHTPSREAGFALFRRFVDPSSVSGWISGINDNALPHARAYLEAAGGSLSADLQVPADVAAELTERIPVDEWQGDELVYDPEAGRLYTYLVAAEYERGIRPKQSEVDAWMARMTDAFERTA